MRIFGKLSLFILCAAWTAPSAADVVTITPSQHGTIIQVPNGNPQLSNALGDIFVGRTNQDGQGPATQSIRRGLIQFDLTQAGIPSNATVTGVSLTLRDVQALNGTQTLTLNVVSSPWTYGTSYFAGGVGAASTQGDVTWLYRSYNATTPSSSTPWNTPGGDFSSIASGSTVDAVTTKNDPVSWIATPSQNAQMLADVQSWLAAPGSNYGWAILGNEANGQTAKRFAASTADSPNPTPVNMLPQLTITFVVPEPATLLLALLGVGIVALGRRPRHLI